MARSAGDTAIVAAVGGPRSANMPTRRRTPTQESAFARPCRLTAPQPTRHHNGILSFAHERPFMPRRPAKRHALPEQLVTHPAQLAACLTHLAKAPLIGFDTEFVGEDAYRPELCLVQVATAEDLFVIDPFTCGPLDGFWELLLDKDRTTVVHAGREDVRMCFFQSGKPPANVFDVQIAAGLVGLTYPIGYAGLVNDLLGQRMTKGETLTDWRRRPLSPAQVRYAFDDVRFLLPAW